MVRRTVLKRVAKEPYWIVNSLSRLDARLKSALERYLPPPPLFHFHRLLFSFFSPSIHYCYLFIELSPRSINVLESSPPFPPISENINFPSLNIFVSPFQTFFTKDATSLDPARCVRKGKLLLFEESFDLVVSCRELDLRTRAWLGFHSDFSLRFVHSLRISGRFDCESG